MKLDSSNPAQIGFKNAERVSSSEGSMTAKGTTTKTLLLLTVLLISSMVSWKFVSGNMELLSPVLWSGMILGLVIAIVLGFKPNLAPILAPLYAIVEGAVVGPITLYFEAMFPGIGLQAVFITAGIFIGMLIIYGYRIIRVTETFKKVIIGLTIGIMIVYLISIIANLFGASIPLIHQGGIVGIGFSLFVITIASMNLLLDFDFIELGERDNLPKYMEWYGSFMLLVTIIWIYIEVLKLLAKLKSND